MKLYDYPSPSPRRVRVFMAEKGIEAERIHTDLGKRENWSEAFLAMNPLHAVPVLETDDGEHLAESVAICRYLEALKPDPPLFGRTPLEKGRIEMWLQRIESQLLRPIGTIWIHGSPRTAAVMKNQQPALAEQARKQAAKAYRLFDEALAVAPYLGGEMFSAADVMALCTVDFGIQAELAAPSPDLKNLKRWHEAVSARPSAAA